MRRNQLVILVLVLLCAACNAKTVSPTVIPLSQKASPTIISFATTTLAFPPTPTTEAIIKVSAQKVSESVYNEFAWVPNSDTLLYDKGPGKVWSYDIATGKNEPFAGGFPWHPNAEVLAALPPNAQNIGSSPSGEKVLYAVPDVQVTPTPFPDGPAPLNRYPVLLWMWDGKTAHKLGTMEDCIDDYLWSANEQVVTISTYAFREPCEVQTWIVDLQAGNVQPLFTKTGSEENAAITDIADDGSAILYNTGTRRKQTSRLFIRQLGSKVDTMLLSQPNALLSAQWLHGEQKLLIGITSLADMTSPQAITEQMSIYDVTTQKMIMIEGLPPETNRIFGRKLSPDRKWLAFETRDENLESIGLWIVALDTVH